MYDVYAYKPGHHDFFPICFAQCLISDGLFARQKWRKDKGAVKKKEYGMYPSSWSLIFGRRPSNVPGFPTSAAQTSLHFYTKITLSALSSHCPIMQKQGDTIREKEVMLQN